MWRLLRRFTSNVLRSMAWGLISLALVMLFFAVLILTEAKPDHDQPKQVAGALLLASVCGIPGGLLMWRIRVAEREATFEAQVAGLVRARDRVQVEEIARKIGRTPLETEALILKVAPDHDIDLTYHRATDEYLHRNRIHEGHRVVQSCAACGASFRAELILEGEQLSCQYCGKGL